MPAQESDSVWHAFELIEPTGDSKLSKVTCRYCEGFKDQAVHATRMKNHLRCVDSLEDPENQNNDIVKQVQNAAVREGRVLSEPQDPLHQPVLRQQTLDVCSPRLLAVEYENLNWAAAMAVYEGGKPLNFYEDPALKELLKWLNPAWAPPSRWILSGKTLDDMYNAVRKQVQDTLDAETPLNFSLVGSSNVNHQRIVNLYANTGQGAFILESDGLSDVPHTAERMCDHAVDRMLKWANGDAQRCNSLSTDTEETMRKMWNLLSRHNQLSNAFCVPCDNHGCQKFIQDIIQELPWFTDIFSKAVSIVTYFHLADGQIGLLRERHQNAYEGKTYASTAAAATHGGIQYGLLTSLQGFKTALQHWATDNDRLIENDKHRKAQQKTVETILLDRKSFWLDLDDTIDALGLIHEAHKRSGAEGASVAHVCNRWKKIKGHLDGLNNKDLWKPRLKGLFTNRPHPKEPSTQLPPIWNVCFERQVVDIHVFAYHMEPVYKPRAMPDDDENACSRFIQQYGPSSRADRHTALLDFFHFRDRVGIFPFNSECWLAKENPYLFWRICKPKCPALAELAMRVFEIPGNATASEQAFSNDGNIHGKTRNCHLFPKKANRLEFIYVNSKALTGKKGCAKPVKQQPCLDMSPEQELKIEDKGLGDGEALFDDLQEGCFSRDEGRQKTREIHSWVDTVLRQGDEDEQQRPSKRPRLSIDTQFNKGPAQPPLEMAQSIMPNLTNGSHDPPHPRYQGPIPPVKQPVKQPRLETAQSIIPKRTNECHGLSYPRYRGAFPRFHRFREPVSSAADMSPIDPPWMGQG